MFVGIVDEGTAIDKATDRSPLGKNFVNYEGMGLDWYLKLTGAATQMIRGDAPCSAKIPEKMLFPQD